MAETAGTEKRKCPECGAKIRASSDVFAHPRPCPKCKRTVSFQLIEPSTEPYTAPAPATQPAAATPPAADGKSPQSAGPDHAYPVVAALGKAPSLPLVSWWAWIDSPWSASIPVIGVMISLLFIHHYSVEKDSIVTRWEAATRDSIESLKNVIAARSGENSAMASKHGGGIPAFSPVFTKEMEDMKALEADLQRGPAASSPARTQISECQFAIGFHTLVIYALFALLTYFIARIINANRLKAQRPT